MTSEQPPPDGFVPMAIKSPFINRVAQFYETWRDGRRIVGVRVEEHHMNSSDAVHGGFLLTLADFALSWGTREPGDTPPRATLSLTMDFALPVRLGAWLEAEVDVLRCGRTTAFVNCFLSADGHRVGRANGVFRIAPLRGDPIAKDSKTS